MGQRTVLPETKLSLNEPELLQMFKEGTLSKCTIPDLKAFLKEKKMFVSGKKGILIERVVTFFTCRDTTK